MSSEYLAELEVLRKKYKPEKIKILFVGESPPKREFFYETKGSRNLGWATKEAFEKAFQKEFKSYQEFLEFFKSQGCYLTDLFYERGKKINKAIEYERKEATERLVKLIKDHKPEIVVVVLKRIYEDVEKAIRSSRTSVEIKSLSFPRGKYRGKYINYLIEILNQKLCRI